MKLFLDTADITEIKAAAVSGLIDGITTNPTLLAKTGRKPATVIHEIIKLIDGPISVEVISTNQKQMLAEGKKLAAIHPNVVVKLPMISAAMPVVRDLTKLGIKTNVTLTFSVNQALLAAKAGATYVSPFVGRLDDIGEDGMMLVSEIIHLYQNYGFTTQVLVASVRHAQHIRQAAEIGAPVATLPYKVFTQLFNHPLTDTGLKQFLADWKTIK